MDNWEIHYRSSVSESGASRSLVGFNDLTDLGIARYMGSLVANDQSAALSASGSFMNCCDHNDGLVDQEDDCVSYSYLMYNFSRAHCQWH